MSAGRDKSTLPWYQDQNCIMTWGKALGMVIGAAAIPIAIIEGVELGGIMSIAVSIFAIVISIVITNASDRRNENFQRKIEDFMPKLGEKMDRVMIMINDSMAAAKIDTQKAISELSKENPNRDAALTMLHNAQNEISNTLSVSEKILRQQDEINRANAMTNALADPNSEIRKRLRGIQFISRQH